jgi:hypothetical protein
MHARRVWLNIFMLTSPHYQKANHSSGSSCKFEPAHLGKAVRDTCPPALGVNLRRYCFLEACFHADPAPRDASRLKYYINKHIFIVLQNNWFKFSAFCFRVSNYNIAGAAGIWSARRSFLLAVGPVLHWTCKYITTFQGRMRNFLTWLDTMQTVKFVLFLVINFVFVIPNSLNDSNSNRAILNKFERQCSHRSITLRSWLLRKNYFHSSMQTRHYFCSSLQILSVCRRIVKFE